VLTSPLVAAAASNAESQDTLWEWLVRMLAWTAGGWHYY